MTAAAKPPRAKLRESRQTIFMVLWMIVFLACVAGLVVGVLVP